MSIYVDSEVGLQSKDLKVSVETNPCSEVDIDSGKKISDKEFIESIMKSFAGDSNKSTVPPKIVTYDDTGKSVKISERYPLFDLATLIDDVLDEFGGVEEIMECKWGSLLNEGLVVCLMKDWRVFRLNLKSHEYASLTYDDRRFKINRDCMIFEDMDEWSHWEELGGTLEDSEKEALAKKQQMSKMTSYGKKYNDSLDDFFNEGSIESMQKMMQKNSGKSKTSYQDAEE
jgi:hypothetical protein